MAKSGEIDKNDIDVDIKTKLLFGTASYKAVAQSSDGYLLAEEKRSTIDMIDLGYSGFDQFFLKNKVAICDILSYDFENTCYYTNFYNLLDTIFEYENVDELKDKSKFSFPLYYEDLIENEEQKEMEYLEFIPSESVGKTIVNCNINDILDDDFKNYLKNIYEDVFTNKYDDISFGLYDILSKDSYEKLSSIVNRLRDNGLNDHKDYVSILGLSLLIESYNKTIIKKRNILVEKLINKYLTGKSIRVYARNIVVKDDRGYYIPINMLSTGEKNIILLFFLCLYKPSGILILDEPDLSMSVDWQSKLLVDLSKHSTARLLVVSQSPLLIQRNTLSKYISRLDFDPDDEDLVDQIIENNNSNDELQF